MTIPGISLTDVVMKLIGPKPKFNKGDSVQCVSGNENDLMVVQWHKVVGKSVIMYSCKWYDSETKSTRTNIFSEDQLKKFDWDHR